MNNKKDMRINLTQLETKRWKALTKKSTVELVRRIVEDSDKLALKVLLDTRRLFRLKDQPPLLLPEFLIKLRDRMAPPKYYNVEDGKLGDCAYDLTLAKYANLPDLQNKKLISNNYSLMGTMVDCRNYYRVFLNSIQLKKRQEIFSNLFKEEAYAGKSLQSLIYKNFLRSKMECRRKSPFAIRYTWEVKGRRITLWYPSYMTAKEFREWLEKNLNDVNPNNPNEQSRIQSLINANLSRTYLVSLDVPGVGRNLGMKEELSPGELQEGHMFVDSLAETVAREKAQHIQILRPGIRKLGEKTIERLVLQIFSGLSDGGYKVTQIAEQYGISKATLSRFAGSKWFKKTGGTELVGIPDLWKNTAKILAGNPAFFGNGSHLRSCR